MKSRVHNRKIWCVSFAFGGFPGDSVVKNPPANAGDLSSIPGSGRSAGEGNGNPLQYSCLENPMDEEVHEVAKSQTQLSDFTLPYLKEGLAWGL